MLIELEENRDGETSSRPTDDVIDVIGTVSLISTEVNVTGDIGDEAASARDDLLLRYIGGLLSKRASAETEVAKTSAVVTVLFFDVRL